MALLVVLAMEKSEGVRARGLCATAAIWLLDCSVEKKSERGKRGCCCCLAYYVLVEWKPAEARR